MLDCGAVSLLSDAMTKVKAIKMSNIVFLKPIPKLPTKGKDLLLWFVLICMGHY